MTVSFNFTEQNLPISATLVDILQQRAQYQPNKTVYKFLEDGENELGSLTYQELDQQARAIASILQTLVASGERALLLYPSGLEFIAAFFGCLYAGVVAVPAYPPRPNQKMSRLQAIVADAQAKVTLTTEALLNNIKNRFAENADLAVLHCLATNTINHNLANLWQEKALSSEDLAFLQYTSGSTGTPKGVMVSHGNLLHNSEYIKQSFELTPDSVSVSWLPCFHDMGLIDGILQPLYTGFLGVLMPPASFVQKPIRWLQAISHYKATHCGGPNFGYDLCVSKTTLEQRENLDLSRWYSAYSGAEPVRKETIEKFVFTFQSYGFRSKFFYPCYGMAEATLMVSGGLVKDEPIYYPVQKEALEQNWVIKVSEDDQNVKHIVGCGHSWNDTKIVIVDPESLTQCSSDQVGEIWVSGSSIAQGYWRREEQTEQTFRAKLQDFSERSFLRTGDLGFLHNGELFVTGRLKDLIIIRGRNHYPQDIELTVEKSHPALRSNSGAAFSVEVLGVEQLVVVQEVERSYLRKLNVDEVIGVIRRSVAEQHDLQVYAVLLLKTMSLPKTSSGKVQRSSCRVGFLSGTLDVVDYWSVSPQKQFPSPHRKAMLEQFVPSITTDKQQAGFFANNISTELPGNNKKSFNVKDIETWLILKVSEQLQVAPNEIDIRQPLAQYGLNSLAAMSITGEVNEWLGCKISPTIVYDYPTIESLVKYLTGSETEISQKNAYPLATTKEAIAIIGIGCRFPGAENPQAFWHLLCNGINAIKEVPSSRWKNSTSTFATSINSDGMHIHLCGFLEQVDQFDPQFFGISPREAELMDPQQRLLLEVCWEAVENAGMTQKQLAGSQTGVFIGISNYDYSRLQFNHPSATDIYSSTGNAFSIAANRLSYVLDLRGPSWAVDTACSSSLVAVHQACQSLRSGECNLALSGGVNLILNPELTIAFSKAGMLAADGRCKTFDAKADGYVRGEGCGVVVLKRASDALRDGDNILALIKGSAVNQDGRSNGLTAPNGIAQQSVIKQALKNANVNPSQISYVEAHGTGTSLGDPIELNAIKEVLTQGRSPDQSCWIGSVKTNIGHLEAAAGIASLIKVVLSLQHEEIPPHLHLTQLNPYISFEGTPFSIPVESQKWFADEEKRLAGVSSFGFGGTNVHIVLEEAPVTTPVESELERPKHIFKLSAKSEKSLRKLAQSYGAYLELHSQPSLVDICYTNNTGRSDFDYRLCLFIESTQQLHAQLCSFASYNETIGLLSGRINSQKDSKIAFLFTGQGSQYIGMGRQLYETQPTFRKTINLCNEILRSYLEKSLLEVLYPKTGEGSLINETVYTQPALFALEYALFQLWLSWGITPQVVMGHSVGEYVAACVAGVFSLEDGLKLIATRGRLMQSLPPDGEMVVVFASKSQVEVAIQSYAQSVAIAAVNGSQNIVISGKRKAIMEVIGSFHNQGIKTKNLNVSHAFHSPLMKPILTHFAQVAKEVTYSSPCLDIVSNVTGTINIEEIATPDYWCRHIVEPVRFATGMQTLYQQGYEIFIEIGPKPILLGMGRDCLPEGLGVWLPSMRQGQSDWQNLLQSLGELYLQGVTVNWSGFDRDYSRRKLQLPTYPFERQHYWLNTSDFDNVHLTNETLTNACHTSLYNTKSSSTNSYKELESMIQQIAVTMPKLLKELNRLQQQQAILPYEVKQPNKHQQPLLLQQLKEIPVSEHLTFLIAYLQREVANVLRFTSSQMPDPTVGFFEMGMDSLLAVELKKQLEANLGLSTSSTLAFNYPNIESLAKYLLTDVIGLDASDNCNVKPQQNDELAQMVIKVEKLSEEEVEALLIQKLANL